jgi:hypothetical protein
MQFRQQFQCLRIPDLMAALLLLDTSLITIGSCQFWFDKMWIISDNFFPLALCLFHYDLNCVAMLSWQQVFNGHQALELTKSSFY